MRRPAELTSCPQKHLNGEREPTSDRVQVIFGMSEEKPTDKRLVSGATIQEKKRKQGTDG